MSTLNNLKIRSPSDEQNKRKKQLKIFPVQLLDILGQAQSQLLKEVSQKMSYLSCTKEGWEQRQFLSFQCFT